MHKRRILALITYFALIMTLTSCSGSSKQKIAEYSATANSAESSIEQIIRPNILPTPEWCKDWVSPEYSLNLDYSDIDGDEVYDLYPFFNVLMLNCEAYDSNYYIYSDSVNSYALINYWDLQSGKVIEKLNKVDGTYIEKEDGTTLSLSFDITYRDVEIGCYPNSSNMRLLIKLNQDIDHITVSPFRETIRRFSGGKVYLQPNVGWLNSDMELVVPAEYEYICKLDTETDETYYFARKSSGAGILSEKYEWILSPELGYHDYFYLNGGFPIAVKYIDRGNNQNYLIDKEGNALSPAFEGNIAINRTKSTTAFNNIDQITTFGYMQKNKSHYGLVNSKLEIILPAIYDEIIPYASTSQGQGYYAFFVCPDNAGKYAVFLPDGTQYTKFQYDSAYDAHRDNRHLYKERN